MNNFEKEKIAKLYAQIAIMYGRQLTQDVLIMMVNSMHDLNYYALEKIMTEWCSMENKFPYPADLRQKLNPTINERDMAVDAVNMAIMCVSKYGWTNPEGAKTKMGELAWETVKRFGGWEHLCGNLNAENEGIMRAQLRELAQVVMKKSIRGELDETQNLPTRFDVQNLVNISVKSLE